MKEDKENDNEYGKKSAKQATIENTFNPFQRNYYCMQ